MLEEEVKNDKRSAPELALSLLQFIQNEMPAGGSSAETRFLRMFTLICDRIFGPILDAQGQYKHQDGGWFSATAPTWYPRSNGAANCSSYGSAPNGGTGANNGNSRSSSVGGLSTSRSGGGTPHGAMNRPPSLERDPVVKFLGTADGNRDADSQPTFIEAISRESSNRPSAGFPAPFHAFPETLREAWSALLEAQLSSRTSAPAPSLDKCSPQTQRLLMGLLRRPPLEQVELQMYKQSQVQKKESAAPLMQLSPRGFPPTTSPLVNAANASINTKDQKKPNEPYVILSMLEYYLFLFVRYPLAKPVPKAAATGTAAGVNYHRHGARRVSESYGDTMYNYIFGRYLNHFVPHSNNGPLSRESELFLRILVSMWFESQGRCQTTEEVIRRQFQGDMSSKADLSSSFDLVRIKKYDPPFHQVQRCLLSLVKHLILDPALEVRDGPNYALTPAMALLQETFFNHVRISFCRGVVHSAQSPFYNALDMWLIWLEPWNVKTQLKAQNATQRIMGSNASGSQGTMGRAIRTLPKVDDKIPSRYSSKWEAYIAANLHLYTVPLAIFLRRARELDFSAQNFSHSIKTVNRVFRVYSPDVVLCLKRLLRREAPEYDSVIDRHLQALGPYAPPNMNSLQLSSCAADMKTLLEEVHLQHSKKVGDLDIFDIMAAKMESFIGRGVISGEEKKMNALVEKARIMVDLPQDYQVVYKSDDTSRHTETKDRLTLTDSQGVLTDEGFSKVYTGEAKCNPADAVYVGDVAKRRLGTDEIPVLVEFFVHLSEWLSLKTGQKVNLRYFANWWHLVQSVAVVLLVSFLAWVWFF